MKNFRIAVILCALAVLGLTSYAQKSQLKAKTTAHSVSLSWTQAVIPAGATCPAGSGSTAVTANTVYRGTTTGGETSLTVLATPATAYTDLAVTAGTTYFYQVTATNCASESGKSNEITATIPNPLPPNPPSGLTGSSQ